MSQSTSSEALVDGVRLPAVCLASPGNPLAIALEDIDRFVGGSAVLHMVEQSRIVLAEHAVDCGPQEAAMIEARRDDGDAGRLFRQGWRGGQLAQIERPGRVLLECPHRRTQPQSSQMRARPRIGLPELALVGLERIESLLDRLQPLQKLLLELVIHSVGIRSIAGQCRFRDYPAFAFSPAASMPATAQVSSLSDVSPLTPTAPSRPPSPWISTPPGTGTRRPCASAFTAPTK